MFIADDRINLIATEESDREEIHILPASDTGYYQQWMPMSIKDFCYNYTDFYGVNKVEDREWRPNNETVCYMGKHRGAGVSYVPVANLPKLLPEMKIAVKKVEGKL